MRFDKIRYIDKLREQFVGNAKTIINIMAPVNGKTANGLPDKEYKNILFNNGRFFCIWRNDYDTETFKNAQMKYSDVATIVVRFNKKIMPDCIVCRKEDNVRFEIISLDDVENRHQFMELKIRRFVDGR